MKKVIIILIGLFNCIILKSQNEQQIINLESFAKLYGYVKYFHPSEEAAETDWDKFAIYGAEIVTKAKDTEELINLLNELFKPIAPSIQITKSENKIVFDIKTITPKDTTRFLPIAWQHLGNGIDASKKNTFKSIRLNRTDNNTTNKNEYGYLYTSKIATEYRGKKIKLTGDVRVKSGSTGVGYLWLKVKNDDNKTGFLNDVSFNPIIDNSWKEYEMIGKVDKDADKIYFGCIFKGNGELLVDNIKLFYKDEKQWKEIPVENYDFEDDNIGEEISSWQSSGDSYLIQITDKKIKENNKCVSIKKLSTNCLFTKYPKLGKNINKELVKGVSCIIPLTLYGNNIEGTFPKSNKTELKHLRKNISQIDKNNINDLYVRLGVIIITWNIIQHFYPYLNELKVNWGKELPITLKNSFACKTNEDFLLEMEKFVTVLKDGQCIFNSKDVLMDYTTPISWDWIENSLVITKIRDSTLNLKVGDIVKNINNQDSKLYFDSLENYISYATKGYLNWVSRQRAFRGAENTIISIELENGLKINLNRSEKRPDLNTIRKQSQKTKYRIYPDNITYLHLGYISMKTIDSILPILTVSRVIICDLRGYPNNNYDFISYLLDKNDTADHIFRIPQILYPDQQNIIGYNCFGWNLKVRSPHINAKIIFIVDGRVIGNTESYLSYIEGYKLATIIGQPTAGTNGYYTKVILPGNIEFYYTGTKFLKINGTQHNSIGIIPNILVEKTIKGIRDGRDEFLEKALEIANLK